tara:strand:+ start:730 stop:1131 length:402 start_codon:yes stop_codon:yes gene_type:complete
VILITALSQDPKMKFTKSDLEIIKESLFKLERKITTTSMTLKLEKETHVPDLMTRIRILPSVAVVAQTEKVDNFPDGDARLGLSLKFLPRTSEIYASVKKLSEMIKKLPGVKSITIEKYNKKNILLRGKKIVF